MCTYVHVVCTLTTLRNCYRQISKKHQIRLDTPWLDPNKTLAEQVECIVCVCVCVCVCGWVGGCGWVCIQSRKSSHVPVFHFTQEVMESDELILMYRFYYHMNLDRCMHGHGE